MSFPPYSCDLHTHTFYSDGRSSPDEMLKYAAGIGIKIFAFSDHDNTRAYRESQALAEKLKIRLVPGIEFTTRWDPTDISAGSYGGDVDLLGYFFNPDHPKFVAVEKQALADNFQRSAACAAALTEAGYPVTLDDAFHENPRYAGAMQLIDALWRNKKYVPGWDEALALFQKHWSQIRLSKLSIREAIDVLHQAGGIAVLAHPVLIECEHGWLQDRHIAELVEMGLDGIEVYHHRLDSKARAYFIEIARQFNLPISGGSDEHGWPAGFLHLGSQPVDEHNVRDLEQRSLIRHAS